MATGAGSGYARIVINAQNNTNPAFQQIQQSLNQMQSQLSNQSGWKSVAAGAAIASAGSLKYGYFDNFSSCILYFATVFFSIIIFSNSILELQNNIYSSLYLMINALLLLGIINPFFENLVREFKEKTFLIIYTFFVIFDVFLGNIFFNWYINYDYLSYITHAIYPTAKMPELLLKYLDSIYYGYLILYYSIQTFVLVIILLFGLSIKRLFSRINN